MTQRLLRLGLFLLLACQGAVGAPEAEAQSRAAVEQIVFVDQIQIIGNADLSDAVLKAAFDLPIGRPLSREALDEHLRAGKQRLEGLGYFRSIDVALKKGNSRGHYRVVLTVEAERSSYFGMTLVRNDNKDESFRGPLKSQTDTYQAYAGSRNLFSTGLRGEFALLFSKTFSDSEVIDSEQAMPGAAASLYDPSLLDSSWFAGGAAGYFSSKSKTSFNLTELPDGSVESKTKGQFSIFYGVVGRRIGLTTTSVGLSRFLSKFETQSSNPDDTTISYSAPATGLFARFSFSDKTYLTKVEPGSALAIDYNRDTAPHYEAPSTGLTALHTWMFGSTHAVTPTLAGQYDYSFSDDNERALSRTYDYSFKYDYVATPHLTLELGYGEYRVIDKGTETYPNSFPHRRKKFAVYYTSSGFLLSLAFQYGDVGLDREQDQLFLPNSDRFTQ